MSNSGRGDRMPLIVSSGQGRTYDMGRMCAVFFADGDETNNRYSISEWSVEPRTRGPGAHSHADDHILYVLAGTLENRELWQQHMDGPAIKAFNESIAGSILEFELQELTEIS